MEPKTEASFVIDIDGEMFRVDHDPQSESWTWSFAGRCGTAYTRDEVIFWGAYFAGRRKVGRALVATIDTLV
jgi:hypothetical protein